MTTRLTSGAHHVGLAVPDLDAAVRFFCDALGFSVAGGNTDYPATFVTDGHILLTLWRAADPANATGFDRRSNIGLHHLALGVASADALDEAYARVRAYPGVTVESEPGPIAPGAGCRHFLFAMPGGIRLELATLMG